MRLIKVKRSDLNLDKMTLCCDDCGKSFDVERDEIKWHFENDMEILCRCRKCQEKALKIIHSMSIW